METTFSLIATLLLSPLWFVISIAIILDSRGPVLFRQIRVGENQQNFTMFKFRSMALRAEEAHWEMVHHQTNRNLSWLAKDADDARVTTVGKFLRRTSLDELPQLLNVIHGNMSLVGPRPMLPGELAFLTEEQMRRFSVAPGITGLAQINGRSELSPRDYVDFDLKLIDGFTWALYWRVLLLTPLAVLSGRGAF